MIRPRRPDTTAGGAGEAARPDSARPGRRACGVAARLALAACLATAALPATARAAPVASRAGGPQQAAGAEAPRERAGRVASMVELAATEYRDAVRDGRVVNEMEYGEARQFVREAAAIFAPLAEASDDPRAAAVSAGLDTLAALAERKGPRRDFQDEVDRVASALAEVWGAISVPEPARAPSAARGARVYRQACAACHGPAGEGDGWASEGMEPPPADLTAPIRWAEATPARDYQVTQYGIPETAMPASRDWLSPEAAWDVVAYLQALRFGGGEVAEGRALALGADGEASPVAGSLRRWASPSQGARLTDRALRDRVQARWREGTGDSLPRERARSVVAFVRTLMGTPDRGVPEASRGVELAAALDRSDSLAAAASALADGGRVDRARSTALRAYMAFETVEPDLTARSQGLTREVEAAFADFRASLGGPGEARVEAGRRLDGMLARARERLTGQASVWSAAGQSFVIILREGFEAILIIGAIIAFLVKTGHEERRKDVYWGVGTALAASVATAFVMEAVLAAAPASRELLEGLTMLLAVVVLFSVSYWLLSKLEHRKWEQYLHGKMKEALGAGGGLALAGVAFLAVYREGFETVLFYQGLMSFSEAGLAPVVGGFAVGCAALAVIYVLFTGYGVRLPMRPFFAGTSAVLYYMAVVFAGSGVHELQEAGVIGTTHLAGAPRVDLLGLYPTAETLAAQGLLLALLAGALWLTFGRGSTAEEDGSAGPTSQSPADEAGAVERRSESAA